MKNVTMFHLTVFLASFLTVGSAHAGRGLRLLPTALQENESAYSAPISKLSRKGRDEFDKFQAYAYAHVRGAREELGLPKKIIVRDWGKELVVLENQEIAHQHTGILQHRIVDDHGNMQRVGQRITPTGEIPLKVEVEPTVLSFNYPTSNFKVIRTFRPPGLHDGEIKLSESYGVKKSEGLTYSVVYESQIVRETAGQRVVAEADLFDGMSVGWRGINVKLKTYTAVGGKFDYEPSTVLRGRFKLPESINGIVIRASVNPNGSRLVFTTSRGLEYTYRIALKPGGAADELIFTQIAEPKRLSGAKNGHFAEVKTYDGLGRRVAKKGEDVGLPQKENAPSPGAIQ